MNRRDFLGLSIKGLFLGAALSTGLGRTALAIAEKREVIIDGGISASDPMGQRTYVSVNGGKTWFTVTDRIEGPDDPIIHEIFALQKEQDQQI